MYGDYEAQRHWMEITYNLKAEEWYINTSNNNLTYWGLDYPPLSAYISNFFAYYINYIDPNAINLHTSHGYETFTTRSAMRLTVLFSDIFVLFPSLYLVSSCSYSCLCFFLTLPSLILIDHAHFQYNGISAALFLFTMYCLCKKRYDAVGSCLYCLCVYFKQMNLYYSLPISTVLLTRFIHKLSNTQQAIKYATYIVISISITTLIIFYPWLSIPELSNIFHRIFPVSRGLYEDKVSNVWCTIYTILPRSIRPSNLPSIQLCTFMTLITTLPFCISIMKDPYSFSGIMCNISGAALSSYLFSFQVHEKQILLPLVPIAALYDTFPNTSTYFSFIATFSIFPLLYREGCFTAYIAMIGIHFITTFFIAGRDVKKRLKYGTVVSINLGLVCILHALLMFVDPGKTYPDIFVVALMTFCCFHFCILYFILLYYSGFFQIVTQFTCRIKIKKT